MNSYTTQNVLIKHEQPCACGERDISSLRLSNEALIYWKKYFHKNLLYFRPYADFEADNEIDNSSIEIKTTNIYEQNPILNGYRVDSQLDDVLNSGYYESPLGYNNVDWSVEEVIK